MGFGDILSALLVYLRNITIEPSLLLFTTAQVLRYPVYHSMVYTKSQEYVLCTEWNTHQNLKVHGIMLLTHPKFNFIHTCASIITPLSITNLLDNVNFTLFNTSVGNFTDLNFTSPLILQLREALNVEIQTLAARVTFKAIFSASAPAIILAFAIGLWSDYFSRTQPVYFSFVGGLLSSLWNMFAARYTFITVQYVILGPILYGMFGGIEILVLACFSYVSAIPNRSDILHYPKSIQETRTIRYALIKSSGTIGILLGTALSTIFLKSMALHQIFTIILGMHVTAVTYLTILFFYQRRRKLRLRAQELFPQQTDPTTKRRKTSFVKLFHGLQPNVIYSSFTTKGFWTQWLTIENNSIAMKVICTCLILNLINFNNIGEYNTLYLYTTGKFNWVASTFADFITVWKAGGVISLILILPLLKHKCKLTDLVVCVMGMTSSILGSLLFGLAKESYEMFIAAVVSMMDVVPCIIVRSSISQDVGNKYLGQVFALIASTTSLSSILSSLAYTKLYEYSLLTHEGKPLLNKMGSSLVYYFSVLLLAIIFPLLWWSHSLDKRIKEQKNRGKEMEKSQDLNKDLVPIDEPSTKLNVMDPRNLDNIEFIDMGSNPIL